MFDDFESAAINSTKWSPSQEVITPTFVRAIQDGKLVLKNQAPLTGILENGVFMTQLYAGTEGRQSRTGCGRSVSTFAITACAVLPEWGGSPVSIS